MNQRMRANMLVVSVSENKKIGKVKNWLTPTLSAPISKETTSPIFNSIFDFY